MTIKLQNNKDRKKRDFSTWINHMTIKLAIINFGNPVYFSTWINHMTIKPTLYITLYIAILVPG